MNSSLNKNRTDVNIQLPLFQAYQIDHKSITFNQEYSPGLDMNYWQSYLQLNLSIIILIDGFNDSLNNVTDLFRSKVLWLWHPLSEVCFQLIFWEVAIPINIDLLKLFLKLLANVIINSSLLDSLRCCVGIWESLTHWCKSISNWYLVIWCGSSWNESIMVHISLYALFLSVN